ncbi:MAG: class I SAM-dependent methyltransferase [Planctomycetes bacterium]|nr:class I SAM-dependent methyltransferase [Planctomycetota bacterium]
MSATQASAARPGFAAVLADLGLEAGSAGAPGGTALVALDARLAGLSELRARARDAAADGWLLVHVAGAPSDADLARVRDAAWPDWHASAVYRDARGVLERRTLEGRASLAGSLEPAGAVLALRRRAAVLAPSATVAKFDRNAAGWNGEPGRPGYAHFRWMRRFVADLAGPHRARRILDFGCGAGWVGIEAALAAVARGGAPELAFFDPSPEMVRIAESNARAAGLARLVGRTGFGEEPPFPGPGEAPYDLVLSSGVVSFARDREAWFDGLARAVLEGGTLVIGDIHPGSKGMARRRREKPLLPIREMNGMRREEARAELERRGFRFECWSGYQLTDPVPQWNHLDATRLGGALGPALLAWNRRAAARSLARGGADQDRFDSWAMRLVRASAHARRE